MKSLVIAEKPSVARDIARVLKCGKNINGAIEGDRYVVTWGLGHLVTLADPEDYDKKYKEWKMEDLPMMPEVFKLEVIKQTSKPVSYTHLPVIGPGYILFLKWGGIFLEHLLQKKEQGFFFFKPGGMAQDGACLLYTSFHGYGQTGTGQYPRHRKEDGHKAGL